MAPSISAELYSMWHEQKSTDLRVVRWIVDCLRVNMGALSGPT
jgi:hypothetical protein